MLKYNNELSKNVIQERIKKRKWNIDKNQFIKELKNTFNLTNLFFNMRQVSHERDDGSIQVSNQTENSIMNSSLLHNSTHNIKEDYNNLINPLLWEYGHILFFWEHLIFKNLNIKQNYITNPDYYDSFKISRINRYKLLNDNKLISYNIIKKKIAIIILSENNLKCPVEEPPLKSPSNVKTKKLSLL